MGGVWLLASGLCDLEKVFIAIIELVLTLIKAFSNNKE